MSGPTWLSEIFAALMIATSLFHAGRFFLARILRRRTEYDLDLAHTAMGATMAVMLVGRLSPGAAGLLAVAAAIPTLWFGWRGIRTCVLESTRAASRDARQAVMSGAMLYMLVGTAVAGSASAAHTHMSGMAMDGTAAHGPAESLAADGLRMFAPILAAAVLGVAVAAARGLRQRGVTPPATAADPKAGVVAPVLAIGCQLAMGVTTAYMLILMP